MSNTRSAPLYLWRIAEAFLHTLYNVFGAPEDVARQHTLTRAPYLLLRDWIRAGEALIRKLVLMEAAMVDLAPARSGARASTKRERHVMSFEHDKPAQWRVCLSFSLGPPASRRRALATAGETPAVQDAPSFYSAWPLAERYEALIRVFNDPAAYARRLARRLHGKPQAARAVLAHPLHAAALVGHIAFADVCVASDESRCAKWPERPDTS